MLYRFLTILDWALIAASLFNTIAMLWLGITVLLTAERRAWGTWTAAGGLMLGGLFFAGHTAVVGRVIGSFSSEMELWWRLGWVVLISAPYLWYVVMAWYSGALGRPGPRRWLAIVSVVGLVALILLLVADPLPSYDAVLGRQQASLFAIGPLPAIALVYPVYSVLCTLLALSVLRAPAVSDRFMGEVARRRARPWLVAASLVLLLVGLAVGAAATGVIGLLRQNAMPGLSAGLLAAIIVFDLAISLLIAAAVVLIGQAVVAYEIFTGPTLPRGELARQWRRALIFAAGYGIAVGWSMSGAGLPELPIYQLLLATLVTTVFFALLGWRAFAERERTIDQLRPFVTSQRLFEGLTGAAEPPADAAAPFHALASGLLKARAAFLIPLGPPAALAGPPLAFPDTAAPPLAAAATIARRLPERSPLCLPVDPPEHAGAIWAVPLYGSRGLIGLLFLGEKRDGGVYTQEEIELARAAGERLIDTQAGAEIARRLVGLQRRRLAESQVIDRRTRRVLHDEVLPQIHAAIIGLQASPAPMPAHRLPGHDIDAAPELAPRLPAIEQLAAVHRQISDLLHALPPAAGDDLGRLGLFGALRRAIDADLGGAFDGVHWEVSEAAEATARALDPISAEALYYAAREAARNAARHGRGPDSGRPLHLTIRSARPEPPPATPWVALTIEDDGVGLSAQAHARPDGHGLALHSTVLAILGGSLAIDSAPGQHTRVTLSLPIGQATI